MTKEEFNKWKRSYCDAFPDCEAWLNNLANQRATLETWFKCLESCAYADVAIATDKIITGELQPAGLVGNPPYLRMEREQTALHMKAYAGRIADDRFKRQKAEREHQRFVNGKAAAKRESGPGAASMFKQVLKIREEGAAKGLEGGSLNLYASEELGKWLKQNSGNVAVGATAEMGDAYE